MEYWLIIFDSSYIFLKGRRIKKNLEYSLVSSWPSLYSQNVGISWDCILLRLTSMFPYSITSIYVPTSTCSFPTALLFLALVQVCLGQLSLKGWIEGLEFFNEPNFQLAAISWFGVLGHKIKAAVIKVNRTLLKVFSITVLLVQG